MDRDIGYTGQSGLAMGAQHPILISKKPIPKENVAALLGKPFDDMIKFVVDLDQKLIALGGNMHVDAEAELLDAGSRQESLWGGNYLPGRGADGCVEYTSMINIRPAQNNSSMEVLDAALRQRMRALVFALVGRGEPLP